MRQMVLVGFLQAQNCTNHVSSWRHPLSRTDSWSPDYYRHIGRVLEHGKFDLGFFDDRLSMPDIYGRNPQLRRFHVALHAPIVLDCRTKPWMPPLAEPRSETVARVDARWAKLFGSRSGIE